MLPLRRDLLALLVLAAITIAQGFYAAKLNIDFYKEHTPFFDSCSYTKQLARIVLKSQRVGVGAGIREGLSGNVALPFLEAAVISKMFAPSRVMGVWLQDIWMIALALSLYWYFARYRKLDRWLAVLLALPFVSFARVYDWDGGLPDFRMDLSLYIFASLTAVWYLGTYETDSRLPWLLAGISAMLACLARATAPVYLLLMIGPPLLVRLITAHGKRRTILVNSLYMLLPVLVSAGAFLAYNFKYLYFYYVTWSPDANRHLPWKESSLHFNMAMSHVGTTLMWCALAAVAINIVCIRKLQIPDWKPLWLALIPPLFLAYRGAGLNPYVSMPAVFGFLLFACVPFVGAQPAARFLWARAAIGIVLAGGAVACAAAAGQPQMYSGPNNTSMPGVRTVIDRASNDARTRGLPHVEFIVPELGDFHSCMITNVLIYEYGALPLDPKADAGVDHSTGRMYAPSGIDYNFPNELAYTSSDDLFWKIKVKGDSEPEKLSNVVSMMAAESSPYLLLPDEATVTWLERDRGFYFINRQTRQIMSRLLALNKWVSLGDPVQVDANEKIEVFAPRETH
jgi:hypothetical protein